MKSNRVDVKWPFDPLQLRDLAPAGVVQFSTPAPSPAEYRKLAHALEKFPKAQLRAYSYGRGYRDKNLSFLRHLAGIRHFVCDLSDVKDLSGVIHLAAGLQSLTLGEFLRKDVSLQPVIGLPNLKSLGVWGPLRDFETTLASLPKLISLSLIGFDLPDLGPLLPLRKLKSLSINYGNTADLRLLPGIGRLEYLELATLRRLTDLTPVGRIESLKRLVLRRLNKVRELPSFKRLRRIEGLYLDRTKGITDLSAIPAIRTLKDLVIVCAMHLSEEDFACLKRLPKHCRVRIGTGHQKRNEAIDAMLKRPLSNWW